MPERTPYIAAGPDWFRSGPSWVKTSRLRRVRLASGARPVLVRHQRLQP